MAKRRRGSDKTRIEEAPEVLSSNPFAGLGGADTAEPEERAAAEPSHHPAPDATPDSVDIDGALGGVSDQIVVRKQRKGHGGKTVTIIEGLPWHPDELDALAKTLRRELGCSGRARDGLVIVAGERQQQVASWLRQRGLQRVVVGN